MVNGEKFQSNAVTLTLIRQCPMSNSSELFSYTTKCSSFKSIEPLFFELSCTQTDRQTDTHTHTDRHTDGHEYSIVAGGLWHNMRRHLLVVSEKKIKMLKTPFVISQGEVLQVAPQLLLEVDPP